ncbi:MAG: hypothetical protein ACXQTQ_02960 [Candidatus Hecatellaceae archaeon]
MQARQGCSVKNSVKKVVKKRFLKHTMARALLLLDAGNYPSRVARVLGVSPQLLHYHIKKWVKMGWLKLDVKTPNVTLYRLCGSVKNFLTGGEVSPYKGVRLHAYSLKFPIVEEPKVSVDWNRVKLCNWTRLVGCEAGLIVEKTTRHVIIHADEVFSEDPNEATLLAILECLRLARILEEKFQMKLGAPKLLRKPHYGVYDPVANWFSKFMELSDDVGKIDRSEGVGEIEFYNAELAKEYLVMPLRMLGLQNDMAQVKEILKTFGEAMREHMSLIWALQAVAEQMMVLIQELRASSESFRERRLQVED